MAARGPKQRALWWFTVPAGIVLVASGVLVGRTSVGPTMTAAHEVSNNHLGPADEARIAAIERELRRLRVTLAAVSRAASQAASMPEARGEAGRDETGQGPIESAPEEGVDPTAADRIAEAERTAFLDGLSTQLGAEPRGVDFDAQTVPTISRVLLQHLGPDVQISDVTCGSSICRAKLTHPESPRLAEDRLSDFMLQRDSLAEMSVQFDLRDEGITTLYFIRADG